MNEETSVESHQLLSMAQKFKITSKLMLDIEKLYKLENKRQSFLEYKEREPKTHRDRMQSENLTRER